MIKEFEDINTEGKYDQIIENETPFRSYGMIENLKKTGLLNFDGIKPVWSNMLMKSLEHLANHLAIDLDKKERMGSAPLR